MNIADSTLAVPERWASLGRLPTEDELPYDDGEPMETARHRDQMILLIESLKAYWSERKDYYVSGNMFLHYDPTDKRHMRGPDFFLVLDTDQHERKSWVVWQEGMRYPDVIVELLSDTTRKVDRGEKKRLYARVFRTGEYYLYDPFSFELEGFSLRGADYVPVAADSRGRIHSPKTGLYLAVRDGWLRWLSVDGKVLPTPGELAQQAMERAKQDRLRSDEERRRADEARRRAEEERQLAEQEQQRAEQERQRAEQEQRRAEQERRRAEQAESLLEAYRKRYGELE
jgi:Uma2 family endonuclease